MRAVVTLSATRLYSAVDVASPDPVPHDVVALALESAVPDDDDDDNAEDAVLRILLLGEGDFDFSVQLARMLERDFPACKFHLTCSAHEQLLVKAPRANVTIDLRFGIDATALPRFDAPFDLVVFNFLAHAGPPAGVDHTYAKDIALARGFFSCVRDVMRPGALLLMANQELEQGCLVLRRNAGLSLNHAAPPRQAGFIPRWTRAFPERWALRFYVPSPRVSCSSVVWWLFSLGPRALVPKPHSDVAVLAMDARPARCVVIGDFYDFLEHGNFGKRAGNLIPSPLARVWSATGNEAPMPDVVLVEDLHALDALVDAPQGDFLRTFTCLFFEAALSRWEDCVVYCVPRPPMAVRKDATPAWLVRAVHRFNALHRARGGQDFLSL